MNPWGYIAAAVIAALVVLYTNRHDPHETLKTFVEIHKELPDEMPQKAELLEVIGAELDRLTKPPLSRREIAFDAVKLARELLWVSPSSDTEEYTELGRELRQSRMYRTLKDVSWALTLAMLIAGSGLAFWAIVSAFTK